MDRDGHVGQILTGREVGWAAWGADGVLALLGEWFPEDRRLWLVRVQ